MNTLDERTQYLLHQYTTGACTPDEYKELLALINIQSDNTLLENYLQQVLQDSTYHAAENGVDWEKMLSHIVQQRVIEKEEAPVRRLFTVRRIAVAAAILLCAGALSWFLVLKNKIVQQDHPQVAITTDVQPGKQGAVLTLGNGQTVVLDTTGNGSLAHKGYGDIVKHDSLLSYLKQNNNTTVSYNTLTTQRGRQFQLLLADGTKAWLNAASSIRFPNAFTGPERKVEITGEVYFEVAKNAAQPFIVTAAGTEVKVLGTHFNINAYSDEPTVNTTLLEGRVQIGNVSGKSAILRPGQQAQVQSSGMLKVMDAVNTEEVMAWKNGFFQFEGANVQTVMRQIARWYDVDIEYRGEMSKDTFGGSMPRDLPLAGILRSLQLSEVHFTIEGKKVIVTR